MMHRLRGHAERRHCSMSVVVEHLIRDHVPDERSLAVRKFVENVAVAAEQSKPAEEKPESADDDYAFED